jgi:hypothetical protein
MIVIMINNHHNQEIAMSSLYEAPSIHVMLKANDCVNNHNGTVTVMIPGGRPLEPEVYEIIEGLLPNLKEKFFDLLTKEALLAALATDADKAVKPKNTESSEFADVLPSKGKKF